MKKWKGTASEKAAHAARALHTAQRAAAETAGKTLTWSGKARIQRSQATLAEVPPFCFLRPGLAPEDAATAAVKALGMSHPADALHTLWKLRAIAQAELPSAQSAAEVHGAPADRAGSRDDAHKSTHKPHHQWITFERMNDSSSPQATVGKRSQPVRKKEKDALASAAKQSPRAGTPTNNRKKGQNA